MSKLRAIGEYRAIAAPVAVEPRAPAATAREPDAVSIETSVREIQHDNHVVTGNPRGPNVHRGNASRPGRETSCVCLFGSPRKMMPKKLARLPRVDAVNFWRHHVFCRLLVEARLYWMSVASPEKFGGINKNVAS